MVIVEQIHVGTMANFVYLVMDERSRDAMVADSGWEIDPVEAVVKETKANVRFAVATHGHFDHVATIHELASNLGAKVVAHSTSPIECELRVKDCEELKLGRNRVRVLHTPGHTEDSICLYDGREGLHR